MRISTSKGDAEKALKELIKKIKSVKVLVGVHNDTQPYPDGTTVPEVAHKNEFGYKKEVPERPFMRSTVNDFKGIYMQMAKKGLKRVVTGKMSLENLVELIGLQITGDIQKRIDDIKEPPNSDFTIILKGSDNPLIDTGHLIASISHKVEGA